MKKLLVLFFLLFCSNFCLASSEIEYKTIGETNENRFVNTAKMRFLDKLTARSFTSNIEIGRRVKFEKLIVIPLKCWKSYPEETPENKLLVKVFEIDKHNKEKQIFYGWIFSSTPSIYTINTNCFLDKFYKTYTIVDKIYQQGNKRYDLVFM